MVEPRQHAGTHRLEVVLGLVALGLFLLLCRAMPPFQPDDAFISYRYAAHLAAGDGLTFNPGAPPVEGYSNLLWIVLLAGLARVGVAPVVAGPTLGVVSGVVALGVLLWALRRRTDGLLGRAGPLLVLATAGPWAAWAVSGMETAFFGLLVLCAVVACERLAVTGARRWAGALLAAGVAVALCRPEGALVLPLLAALVILAARGGPLRPAPGAARMAAVALAGFVVAMLAYGAWKAAYFGALAPTPFVSKGSGGGLPVTQWRANFRHYFEAQNGRYSPFGFYYVWLVVLALGGAWVARSRSSRTTAGPTPGPGTGWLEVAALVTASALAAVYVSFTDWMPGMRYFVPLIPLLALASRGLFETGDAASGTGGTAPAASAAGGRGPSARNVPRELAGVAVVAAVAVNLFATTQVRMDVEGVGRSTRESLVELGLWLREAVPAGTLLAVADVGAAAYYSGLPVLDINPESLTDARIAREGWSADYVLSRRPGVVVLVSFSRDVPVLSSEHAELLADPRFDGYRKVGVVRYAWHGDRSYHVWLRSDVPLERGAVDAFPEGLGSLTPGTRFPVR